MKTWQRNCKLCPIHKQAQTVGMRGLEKSDSPALVIYIDNPTMEEDRKHKLGDSRNVRLLRWLLARMSVAEEHVAILLTLKCYKGKDLTKKGPRLEALSACEYHRREELKRFKPKAIVLMGSMSCEAFLGGKQLKDREGADWQPNDKYLQDMVGRVWVTYSLGYAGEKPAETTGIYGILFLAAQQANLNPRHNPNVKPFDFDQF